jgi:hypothetical protein
MKLTPAWNSAKKRTDGCRLPPAGGRQTGSRVHFERMVAATQLNGRRPWPRLTKSTWKGSQQYPPSRQSPRLTGHAKLLKK